MSDDPKVLPWMEAAAEEFYAFPDNISLMARAVARHYWAAQSPEPEVPRDLQRMAEIASAACWESSECREAHTPKIRAAWQDAGIGEPEHQIADSERIANVLANHLSRANDTIGEQAMKILKLERQLTVEQRDNELLCKQKEDNYQQHQQRHAALAAERDGAVKQCRHLDNLYIKEQQRLATAEAEAAALRVSLGCLIGYCNAGLRHPNALEAILAGGGAALDGSAGRELLAELEKLREENERLKSFCDRYEKAIVSCSCFFDNLSEHLPIGWDNVIRLRLAKELIAEAIKYQEGEGAAPAKRPPPTTKESGATARRDGENIFTEPKDSDG